MPWGGAPYLLMGPGLGVQVVVLWGGAPYLPMGSQLQVQLVVLWGALYLLMAPRLQM